ncbi:DUF4913 domain-containing protein [Yinghuangia sp. YIM S10712]|uniref:DUF4913 domain-containing protein n=1 Tax=Yinghuangia sp. YIM S10712 TaxID=3436930 RepID=UPI003F531CEC
MTADLMDPWGQGRYALHPPAAPAIPQNSTAQANNASSPLFASVEVFVNTYLSRVVCRRLGQGTAMWCPEWWRHPEAVVRFDGLWRAFEYFVVDTETGVSTWWLHHADPHLRAILDPDFGPFALCDPEDGHARHPLEPLPVRPAPEGTWENPLYRITDDDSGRG